MLLFGLTLVAIAVVLTSIYAFLVATMNEGRRLPLVTGRYSVTPTLRVTSFRAVGAAVGVFGASNVVQALWTGQLIYGVILTAATAAAVVIAPWLAVSLRHNAGLERTGSTRQQ